MIDYDDVALILRRLGVDFIQKKSTNEFAVYEVPMFGLKVIWSATKYEELSIEWNIIIIYPHDDTNMVRENIIWELARGGFFHYLRTTFPNTFNQMLSGRQGADWHNKIINKRLETYGNKPKYNYYRNLNKDGLKIPFSNILSVEPGFYDVIE
jgi:hypothetical protein